MSALSWCEFRIVFVFGNLNDQHMQVMCTWSDQTQVIEPNDRGFGILTTSITLPTKLHLIFSGKNMQVDSVIDAQGQLLADKFVLIKRMSLDGHEVDKNFLEKHLALQVADSDQIVQSNYVGFNGAMTIDLDRDNVFLQVQKMNRIGRK